MLSIHNWPSLDRPTQPVGCACGVWLPSGVLAGGCLFLFYFLGVVSLQRLLGWAFPGGEHWMCEGWNMEMFHVSLPFNLILMPSGLRTRLRVETALWAKRCMRQQGRHLPICLSGVFLSPPFWTHRHRTEIMCWKMLQHVQKRHVVCGFFSILFLGRMGSSSSGELGKSWLSQHTHTDWSKMKCEAVQPLVG